MEALDPDAVLNVVVREVPVKERHDR